MNLETAYFNRSPAHYDSCLYDAAVAGDTTDAFTFRFWDRDVALGRVPFASWDRAHELEAATRMFQADTVSAVRIRLTYGQSVPVNVLGVEHEREIEVTDVYLTVEVNPGPDQNTYLVEGGRAYFRFKPQWVTTDGDTCWRIVRWEDRGIQIPKDAAAVLPSSWGQVKVAFGD
jgi:hypothetical protein